MTVYLMISLPKIPYIHRIYMVLANPTYMSLWLGKTYVLPEGMYAGRCGELRLLKRIRSSRVGMLGVKRTTTNWAVLRECGHEPLQPNSWWYA